MGLHSRKPTSNEPEGFDRVALLLRLDDDEVRRYILYLEGKVEKQGKLLAQGEGLMKLVVDALHDEEGNEEFREACTKWLDGKVQ